MSEIKPVDHIFCITLPSRKKATQFDVMAKHSDGTTHDVGTFGTLEDAEIASRKWKAQYVIGPASKLILC